MDVEDMSNKMLLEELFKITRELENRRFYFLED